MTDLVYVLNGEPWADQAACLAYDPELFFPVKENGRSRIARAQQEQARVVCRECPVRDQCLRYALDNREPWGMWGGLTPRERDKIRQGKTGWGVA